MLAPGFLVVVAFSSFVARLHPSPAPVDRWVITTAALPCEQTHILFRSLLLILMRAFCFTPASFFSFQPPFSSFKKVKTDKKRTKKLCLAVEESWVKLGPLRTRRRKMRESGNKRVETKQKGNTVASGHHRHQPKL
jgi:hypothetical protein